MMNIIKFVLFYVTLGLVAMATTFVYFDLFKYVVINQGDTFVLWASLSIVLAISHLFLKAMDWIFQRIYTRFQHE